MTSAVDWTLQANYLSIYIIIKCIPQLCTADAEIKCPPGESPGPGLYNVPADTPPRWQKVRQSHATRPRFTDVPADTPPRWQKVRQSHATRPRFTDVPADTPPRWQKVRQSHATRPRFTDVPECLKCNPPFGTGTVLIVSAMVAS